MPDPSLCVSSASCGISHLLYVYKHTIQQSTGKWQILEMHFTFKLSFANFLDTPPLFFSIINIRKRVTLSCSSKINSNFYFLKKLYNHHKHGWLSPECEHLFEMKEFNLMFELLNIFDGRYEFCCRPCFWDYLLLFLTTLRKRMFSKN